MAVQEVDNFSGALGGDAEWFSSDLSPSNTTPTGLGQQWTIEFSVDTASVVEYTLDSGATWISFKDGVMHVADAGNKETVIIDGADTFNIRATAALTVNYCRVYIS